MNDSKAGEEMISLITNAGMAERLKSYELKCREYERLEESETDDEPPEGGGGGGGLDLHPGKEKTVVKKSSYPRL